MLFGNIFCLLSQENNEINSRNLTHKKWRSFDNLNKSKIGDTIIFVRQPKSPYYLKFKSNGNIVIGSTISDYSGKHFIKQKGKFGKWEITNNILEISLYSYNLHLELISRNDKSFYFKVINSFPNLTK